MTICKQKILILFVMGMLVLAGCSNNTAEQVPTTPPHVKSTQAPPTLAPTTTPMVEITPSSPKPPSNPARVPVIPNASKITGKILSVSSEDAGFFVELLVISSEPVSGFGDFGAAVVGTTIKAKWMDSGIPIINPDQVITGKLRYQGDEKGGLYLLSQVK